MQTISTSHQNRKRPGAASPLPKNYYFEEQCARILSRTAHFLANSPGGLHFEAGTRPWLMAVSTPYPQASCDAS